MVEPSEPVPEVEYYANGQVKFRGFRLGNDLHGAWEWFRTDGSLMRTGRLDRGRQVGVWRTFDRSAGSSRRPISVRERT